MQLSRLTRNVALTVFVAIIGVILSAFMGLTIKQGAMLKEHVHLSAQSYFDGILITRRWNANHGGVFVLKREDMASNPYIENPDITCNGKTYTMKNPAVMTREISELAEQTKTGFQFHIASLRLLNPDNAPDTWERDALRRFESGASEFTQITEINGKKTYRLMRPLLFEQGCVDCHGKQGYAIGDVRGGISVALPYDEIEAALTSNRLRMIGLAAAITALIGATFYFIIWKFMKYLVFLADELESKRKEAEASLAAVAAERRTLDNIVSSIDADLLILDKNLKILWTNKRLRERDPYSRGEIVGQYCNKAYCNIDYVPKDCPAVLSLRGGVPIRKEHPIKHPDGSTRHYLFTCSPIEDTDGGITSVIELVQDITEKKDIEIEIQKKASDLEQANKKLRELDRLKSMFIASMSHELRTPLNSIIGFSSILLDEWLGALNDEQKKNLESVLRSGRHLLSLINDVIDVSKIEAGKLEAVYKDFDLRGVMEEAAEMFKKEAKDRGLELRVEPLSIALHTDRRRLLQSLANLIGNAVKFTEKGSVSVTARPLGEQLEITVADTGIGINEEDMPKLFGAFVRISSPLSAKVSGTGLGLYLTKKIVTATLMGEIEARSEYGRGSTFGIKIPMEVK